MSWRNFWYDGGSGVVVHISKGEKKCYDYEIHVKDSVTPCNVYHRGDSAHFNTWLRFVSRPPAFCLKTSCVLSQDLLRFVSRLLAFCLKASCVLSTFEDLFLCFGRKKLWTDFASWQRRIRLYCRGKENGVNILKLIDEGPFQMGTVRELLVEGTEGAPHLGPERPRVYSDLSPEEKDRYNADIRAKNILLQGLPKDIYTLINHYTDAKDIWDNVNMLLEGSALTKEDQESQLYDDFEHF
uniref:Integrase, catalytic region, zinc finger, CCHC-type, peptidase aspartic, catalytic n=1 Tax=Tanacetum cinerariifolium TaxID=118510 RepID=A0A6L2JUZ3_TANCI|nr:integrase, catalytic region, zinc finger, CCHC-type, peptidase aspartic, catalytic [Tanacetum cinerariifolium]